MSSTTTTPNLNRAHTSPIINRQSTSSTDQLSTPVRTPSKQAYTTEIVKSLFGGEVGEVVIDVSCSFQRQAGRLYVSTNAIFYYSNLFGFEKKIRIGYESTRYISKIRSTSLMIKTIENGEYIFRSFDNRQQVLEIILRYHSNNTDASDGEDGASSSPTFPEEGSTVIDNSHDETDDEDKSVEQIPIQGNTSESIVAQSSLADRDDERQSITSSKSVTRQSKKQDSDKSYKRRSSNALQVGDKSDDDIAIWKKIKQNTKDWESAINIKLPCKSFFQLFLDDDATNSMNTFLSDIGDTNITIGKWQNKNDGSMSRQLNYDHKSGLAVAKVSRHQTYQRITSNHSCLKNITKISGIKAVPKDTFYVEDVWLIESSDKGIVSLNIRFHVHFTKSTMLKSVITRRAKTEAMELYTQYVRFLRKKLHQTIPAEEEEITPTTKANDWVDILQSLYQQYVPYLSAHNTPILFLAILVFIVHRLKQRVILLEGIIGDFEQRLLELEKLPEVEEQLPTADLL